MVTERVAGAVLAMVAVGVKGVDIIVQPAHNVQQATTQPL
jgi:hypothetical protein